ncbi:MAG: hypothetical protein AAF490_10330 [Chloroflexota bacterium]
MDEKLLNQLKSLNAKELREVVKEANRLLKRKKLYIREISKVSSQGRYLYLYATWQEEGKTKQKSLGRKVNVESMEASAKVDNPFHKFGVVDLESIQFLQEMADNNYFITL